MKILSILRFVPLGMMIVILLCLPRTLEAQSGPANSILSQLSAAFSGGNTVRQVQISGTATWHAGSLEDSGAVSLRASADGSSQMQLQLAETGTKTETQTRTGSNADCQWSGTDGVIHGGDLGNCLRPALWFLPALSFQSALLSSYSTTVDLGTGTVGSSENVYRHLQSQIVLSNLTSQMAKAFAQRSTTDIGLDPTTLLPAVLTYSVHPDNGASTPMAVEVRYSDYRGVDGVQIPFHIQRYINSSLQLDILVSSAQIS